ncbi:MAG: hypothetical protein AAGC60_09860 [Acidobacteriota bacterium]
MKAWRSRAVGCVRGLAPLVGLVIAGGVIAGGVVAGGAPQTPALDELAAEVVDLWAEADLVCLGETHGSVLDAALREAVVRHPRFVETVEVIVVEFANPRHQAILDRLVLDGEDLSREQLRPVWRDAGLGAVWELELYESFLRAVAAANAGHPRARRPRIVGAALPIDWSAVEHAEDLADLPDRLDHFATVLRRESLAPARKALAIFGRAHCERRVPAALAVAARDAPGRARTVLAADPALEPAHVRRVLGLDEADPMDTARLVPVRDTARADRAADSLFFEGHAVAGLTLGNLTDAVVLHGRRDTVLSPPWVGSSPADASPELPEELATELARRARIWHEAQRERPHRN